VLKDWNQKLINRGRTMIGKNIFDIRKRKGLTLSELAERANISKSYLSNIERSLNKNPSIKVLEKVAKVLGVDLEALLIGTALEKERPDQEVIELASELMEIGLVKEHMSEFKSFIEFIKWKNRQCNE
jgi:XRE family transcriptional regulator, master regulator for biofilm formation